jgi:hypothetical protein
VAILYPHRNSDVRGTLLEDGHLILLDPQTSWAHTLNPMAAVIWEFSDGEHTLTEIANEINVLGRKTGATIIDQPAVEKLVHDLIEGGLMHNDAERSHCALKQISK